MRMQRLRSSHARLVAFEIVLEQLLVFFHRHLDQLGVQLLGLVRELGGNFDFVELRAELFFVPDAGLHLDDIDRCP